MTTVVELEQRAQQLAERRLAYANALLFDEEDEDTAAAEFPGEELAGPYCGCETCIVREVLHAAYPAMLEIARLEAAEGSMTGERRDV